MLVIFRSKADADIHMYPEHARMLLEIAGKPFEPEADPRGIFTVEQVPLALAALKAAAARSAAEQKAATSRDEDEKEKVDAMALPVGLAQRAFPLITMLERAQKKGAVVTWGV